MNFLLKNEGNSCVIYVSQRLTVSPQNEEANIQIWGQECQKKCKLSEAFGLCPKMDQMAFGIKRDVNETSRLITILFGTYHFTCSWGVMWSQHWEKMSQKVPLLQFMVI